MTELCFSSIFENLCPESKEKIFMSLLDEIYEAVVNRDRDRVIELAKEVVSRSMDPTEAIEKGFKRGMEKIGDMFAELGIDYSKGI